MLNPIDILREAYANLTADAILSSELVTEEHNAADTLIAAAKYLKARMSEDARIRRNRNRRTRHAVMTSLGLKRVKGALGGVYYE
jgi:hypothetical protein